MNNNRKDVKNMANMIYNHLKKCGAKEATAVYTAAAITLAAYIFMAVAIVTIAIATYTALWLFA
jgi:hypothetical protein